MEERHNAWFTVLIIGVMICIISLADLLFGSRLFVKKEGVKALESLRMESIAEGEFERAYEDYTKEHFIGRKKYEKLIRGWDILTFTRELNGVFLGKKKRLLPMHSRDLYTMERQTDSIRAVMGFVEKWDARVMAVPTADGLYPDRLPAYADSFSQAEYLDALKRAIGEEYYVDVYQALRERGEEYLYYNTDSRWTSLGAYYAALRWAEHMGKSYPFFCDTGNMTCLSNSFSGDLARKADMQGVGADSIFVMTETKKSNAVLTFEDGTRQVGLYNPDGLRGEDKYRYFPGQEHGYFRIDTGYSRWKSLFVVKDSYGDCLLPLLTSYYKEIHVVDVRYYQGDIQSLLETLKAENELEVLVIGNVPEMIERAGSLGDPLQVGEEEQ